MSTLEGDYTIYIPGGNNTALVTGLGYTPKQRKLINDYIMNKNSDVEQVGFIDDSLEIKELKMAGGEFCGNATRSAAYVYLKGKPGTMKIKINNKYVNAGVNENGEAWCENPLIDDKANMVSMLEDGIYKVLMDGMVTIVVLEEKASDYLKDKTHIKEEAMQFISKFHLENSEAVGVMFLENDKGMLKINPIVWVNAIDTLFYETACGSGTTATAVVKSLTNKGENSFDILQPSGYVIKADVTYNNGIVDKVCISGNIKTDNVKRSFIISEQII